MDEGGESASEAPGSEHEKLRILVSLYGHFFFFAVAGLSKFSQVSRTRHHMRFAAHSAGVIGSYACDARHHDKLDFITLAAG